MNFTKMSDFTRVEFAGVKNGRQVLTGVGLEGGGNLSADRTINLHPYLYFQVLPISDVVYDVNNTMTEIVYTTGNKMGFTYDGENVSIVKYYATDGATLIASNSFSYNVNGDIETSSWDL
jgi:hypothetical protein